MATIGSIVLGVDDLQRALSFWTAALHYVPRDPVGDGDDWVVLMPTHGTGSQLALDVSESPVQVHPRVHLDLYPEAGGYRGEIERLLSLGAQRVDWDLYPEDPDFTVLADPEGNRFCVIDTSRGG